VRSEIHLPELLPWDGPDGQADIHIRLGAVPEIPNPANSSLRLKVDSTGFCRFELPGSFIFGVRDGSEIIVESTVPPDSIQLRNYLFGTGLALICHQRGVFPLHGSCLKLGEQAVIFTGNSGAGKSTLAAALTQHGYPLLSDDVCVLEYKDGWMVRPAFPRVKLHPASLEAVLGVASDGLEINPQGKHHFRFESVSFEPSPVPLAAIYFLERLADGLNSSILDVKGIERLELIRSQIFRRSMGRTLGKHIFLRTTALQIASQIPIRKLFRSFDLDRITETVHLLEQFHGQPPE
jgi:hypothetical protein